MKIKMLFVFIICSKVCFAQPELIGVAEISGTASDLSGQSNKLENGEPHDRLGGFSALEYTGVGNRYVALPDRGPDDGATGYVCRYQTLDILIGDKITTNIIKTTLLKDSTGSPFTGSSRVYSHRLDPEGFRFTSDGSFFLSDEYGPLLIHFSKDGKEITRIPLPKHLLIINLGPSKNAENFHNKVGRSGNKGMEGLAISADGKVLTGIMQHVLLQDGEREGREKPKGVNCRIVQIDLEGKQSEYVYQLDDVGNGLNEIVAVNDTEFLVIERDGEIGSDAKFKKIMKIDISNATNVIDIHSLPAYNLPDSIQPVEKEEFIDFLNPAFKLSAKQIPEKLEGLTWGPTLPNGKRALLVSSDNDFEADIPSLIYVFGVDND